MNTKLNLALIALLATLTSANAQRVETIDLDELVEGQSCTYTTYLARGQVVNFGATPTDRIPEDIDIIVRDPRGRIVAKDQSIDATPVVIFLAECSGNYKVEVKMHETHYPLRGGYRLVRVRL